MDLSLWKKQKRMANQMNVPLLVLLTTLMIGRPGEVVGVSVEVEERAMARIQQVIRENPSNPPNSRIDNVSLFFCALL